MTQLTLFDDDLSVPEWPIRITNYLYEDYTVSEMEEWLEEGCDLPQHRLEEFAEKILNLCHEVAVDIDCYEDGTCKIVGVR
jgi:hypothetical protein